MQAINPTQDQSLSRPPIQSISDWFEQFISHVSVDKMMMETNTAPVFVDKFYTDIINKDFDATNTFLRVQSTGYFIAKIVNCYLKELHTHKLFPQKLAFDFSDAKILVWAQIPNESEKHEDALILAEAEANAKYADNGFYISSTIVEEGDKLPIPPHYKEIKINGRVSSAR